MKNQTNSVKTPFSTSELRVVELLAQGYTEKEIAEKLCISPHTVNNHLRNI
jgi:DNA-binding CsgD family transcriptional regulator